MPQRFRDNAEELLVICAAEKMPQEQRQKALALISAGIDWTYFAETAIKGEVTALVYQALNSSNLDAAVPEKTFQRLRSRRLSIIANTSAQHEHLCQLLRVLARENIAVLPLKGTLLSQRLYGNIDMRGASVDIDLLIPGEDKERVKTLLPSLGYMFDPGHELDRWQWQYTFNKARAASVEVHWDITMMVRNQSRIAGLWDGARLVADGEISYYELKPEELLLYLAVHLINSSRLSQLRYVSDINTLLRKYCDRLNWDDLVEKSKNWRVSNALYAALSLSRSLFNSNVDEDAFKKLKPNLYTSALIKMFINRKVYFRNCLRKRLINNFISYIFFELLEARTGSDYLAVAKRVLFPPREVLSSCQRASSAPLPIRYIIRIFKGGCKFLVRR
ncbi:nucleotidyltransferase family protein [Candidatus Omnitrophota bacterium]